MTLEPKDIGASVAATIEAIPAFREHWWTLGEAAQLLAVDDSELTKLLGKNNAKDKKAHVAIEHCNQIWALFSLYSRFIQA